MASQAEPNGAFDTAFASTRQVLQQGSLTQNEKRSLGQDVPFDTPSVFRVHITNGGFDLNLQQFGANDAVAMDGFIYGEPLAVPEPATLLLFLPGLALLGLRRTGQRTS